jgi:hypothetical protein
MVKNSKLGRKVIEIKISNFDATQNVINYELLIAQLYYYTRYSVITKL